MFDINSILKKTGELKNYAKNMAQDFIETDEKQKINEESQKILLQELGEQKEKNSELQQKIDILQSALDQTNKESEEKINNLQKKLSNHQELQLQIEHYLKEYKSQIFQEEQQRLLDAISKQMVNVQSQSQDDPDLNIDIFELLNYEQVNYEIPSHQMIFNAISSENSESERQSHIQQIQDLQQQVLKIKQENEEQLQIAMDQNGEEIIQLSRQLEQLNQLNNDQEKKINTSQEQIEKIQQNEQSFQTLLKSQLESIVNYFDDDKFQESFDTFLQNINEKNTFESFFKKLLQTIQKNQSNPDDQETIDNLTNNQKVLQKEIQDLQKSIQETQKVNQNKQVSLQKEINLQIQTISDLQKQKKGLIEEIQRTSTDVENWQSKYKVIKEQTTQIQDQNQNLEKALKQIDSQKEEIKLQKQKEASLENSLKESYKEQSQLQQAIQNLQQIYEEQTEKQQSIEMKYKDDIKKLRLDLKSLEQIQILKDSLQEQYSKKDQDLQQAQQVIEHQKIELRSSELQLQEHKQQLLDFIKKVKTEQSYQNFMVDKRVLSKFLVNYFDLNTDFQVKVQILETLSNILSFTEEDKKKVLIQIQIGIYKDNLKEKLKTQTQYKEIEEVDRLEDKLALFLLQQD